MMMTRESDSTTPHALHRASTVPSRVPPLGRHRRLRVLDGPLRGLTFPVCDGLRIGRSYDADVQLVDGGASRVHARVRRTASGRDELEDLDSRNGTVVDLIRIRRQLLAPDMVFTIGTTHIVYESAAADRPGADEAARRASSSDPRSRRSTLVQPRRPVPAGPALARRDPDAPRRRRPCASAQPTQSLAGCLPSGPVSAPPSPDPSPAAR